MLKIRLKRVGRRHDPSFRIVVLDSRTGPKSGKYKELLGTYNPRSDARQVNAERVQYWIGQGAQVSDTVHNILVAEGIIEGKKVNVLPRKSPIVSEEAAQEEAAATESEAEASSEEATEAPADETAAEATESTDESAESQEASATEQSEEETPEGEDAEKQAV